MLDIREVRRDPVAVAAALAKRGVTFDVAAFEVLDARRKAADVASQDLLAERKSASRKIGQLVGQGMSVDDAKAEVNATLDAIAARIDSATEEARDIQRELDDWLGGLRTLKKVDVPAFECQTEQVELLR